MPSAGDLRERIRLEEPTPYDDGAGNTVQGWTARGERAAMFVMKPGSESVLAARLEGRQPITVIMRFDTLTAAVTPAWRAVDTRSGQLYRIKASADMDRRRAWWTLVCEAEVT